MFMMCYTTLHVTPRCNRHSYLSYSWRPRGHRCPYYCAFSYYGNRRISKSANKYVTWSKYGRAVVDPTGDSDADGLTNADEKIWGTNPNAQDTDNDGFKDGEEVAANHNPTIPSPNDKLPAGFVPGQNIAPLEGSAPSQTSFESFFADNVDLTGGKVNLTQEYGRTVANNEKSPTTLSQFVQQQPIITTLPRANVSAIKTEATTLTKVADYVLFTGEIGQ